MRTSKETCASIIATGTNKDGSALTPKQIVFLASDILDQLAANSKLQIELNHLKKEMEQLRLQQNPSLIEEAIEDFDFEMAVNLLGVIVSAAGPDPKGERETAPTIDEIRAKARELLAAALEDPTTIHSCSRTHLEAQISGCGSLMLEFVPLWNYSTGTIAKKEAA